MNKEAVIFFLYFNAVLSSQAQISRDTLTNLQSADSMILLNEVSVVAYRVPARLHQIPGSISILFGRDLSLSNSTDPSALLNSLPGVNMQSGTLTTSRIVIRGMGSRTPYNTNRIRTYLNDIPLTGSDGISTPEEIDFRNLEKIEIIKGPSSALYGSGLGGSINLYTIEKSVNELNLSSQYESFNTIKTNISGTGKIGNVNLWGSFNQLYSDGYRENNKYKRTSILSTSRWKNSVSTVKTMLFLTNIYGGIPSSVGKTLYEDEPQAAAPNWKSAGGFKEYFKGVASASLEKIFSDKLKNDLSVFGRWNNSYEKRPFNNLDDNSLSIGLRNKISYNTFRTDFLLGLEIINETYKWKLDMDNILINENKESRFHMNIFGIAFYKPVSPLNISLAGALNQISYRLTDLFSPNGDQTGKRNFPLIFSPRLGINYSISDHIALYGSAGHGFSMPSPEETLLPEGSVNGNIRPEKGFQYETGIRLNLLNKTFELDGSVYRIDLNDLLITKRITEDIFTGINAGKTRHKGIELLIKNLWFDNGKIPGRLTSLISYTSSNNKFIDFRDNGSVFDGKYLPGIPSMYLRAKLAWNFIRQFEITPEVLYSGFQYLTDDNSDRYPGYTVINLRFSSEFKFKRAGELYLYAGINNLTNTKYSSMLIVNALALNNAEPRYYYPGLPINCYAGLQLHF